MDNASRKQLERNIYNKTMNAERPSYGSFWDRELYDAMFSDSFNRRIDEWGSRYLRDKKVLILGAGANEVKTVSRFTSDVHALNISEVAVESLKQKFPNVNCFVADAEKLVFEETYDVIYCKSVLHHLHPIDKVIEDISNSLCSKGILFIAMEPGLYNPAAALGRIVSPSQSHTPGERPFVFSQFKQMVVRHFDLVDENYCFLFAHVLPIIARRAPIFKPVCSGLLRPVLGLEKHISRIHIFNNLYWIMSSVYERNN